MSLFRFSLMFLLPSTPAALSVFYPFTFLRLWVPIPDFWQSEIPSDETFNSCFLKPLIFRIAKLSTFPFTSVAFLCSLTFV